MKCPKCGHRWQHTPYEPITRNREIVILGIKHEVSVSRYEYDGEWMAQYKLPGHYPYSHSYGRTAKAALKAAADHIRDHILQSKIRHHNLPPV